MSDSLRWFIIGGGGTAVSLTLIWVWTQPRAALWEKQRGALWEKQRAREEMRIW